MPAQCSDLTPRSSPSNSLLRRYSSGCHEEDSLFRTSVGGGNAPLRPSQLLLLSEISEPPVRTAACLSPAASTSPHAAHMGFGGCSGAHNQLITGQPPLPAPVLVPAPAPPSPKVSRVSKANSLAGEKAVKVQGPLRPTVRFKDNPSSGVSIPQQPSLQPSLSPSAASEPALHNSSTVTAAAARRVVYFGTSHSRHRAHIAPSESARGRSKRTPLSKTAADLRFNVEHPQQRQHTHLRHHHHLGDFGAHLAACGTQIAEFGAYLFLNHHDGHTRHRPSQHRPSQHRPSHARSFLSTRAKTRAHTPRTSPQLSSTIRSPTKAANGEERSPTRSPAHSPARSPTRSPVSGIDTLSKFFRWPPVWGYREPTRHCSAAGGGGGHSESDRRQSLTITRFATLALITIGTQRWLRRTHVRSNLKV